MTEPGEPAARLHMRPRVLDGLLLLNVCAVVFSCANNFYLLESGSLSFTEILH